MPAVKKAAAARILFRAGVKEVTSDPQPGAGLYRKGKPLSTPRRRSLDDSLSRSITTSQFILVVGIQRSAFTHHGFDSGVPPLLLHPACGDH